MPIRDISLTVAVFALLPVILMRPYVGVLTWSWLSYMNPHRLTWSFAYDMPFAQIVAITLFIAILINKDRKSIPLNATTWTWIIFLVWMSITTIAAINSDAAFEYYTRVIKIQAITFFTMMLITNTQRLNMLLWVIAMSIGFFSIKGGVFTLITGGAHRVYGPAQSMIAENNALGLATLMIIPVMIYLHRATQNIWVKRFLLLAIVLSAISALGSQSRGAFLAIGVVGVYFWWQSRSKVATGLAVLLFAFFAFMFMPQNWHERMDSIRNYQDDPSAMSRIWAWGYSVNLANDRILGGGFGSWSKATYEKYQPQAIGTFVAHSIYFNVLADHGWIGLAMFLSLLGLTWRNLSVISKRTRGDPDSHFDFLARMIKVSMVAYLSGGAFLSLSYFDLPWHLMAVSVLVRSYTEQKQSITEGLSGRAAALSGQHPARSKPEVR